MATPIGGKVCVSILAIVLVLLSLVTFVVMLALGAWGVVRAQVANPCSGIENITAGCSPEFVLVPTVNDTATVDPGLAAAIAAYNPLEYTHWLGAASGVGVLWAVIQTFAGVALIALIHWVNEDSGKKKPAGKKSSGKKGTEQSIPLETIDSGTGLALADEESDDGITESTVITVGDHEKQEWVDKPLRMFNVGAAFGLFFSQLFFVFAILCMLWGIGIAFDHTRRDDERSVATFVIVELLTAVVLPICLFIFGFLLAAVLDFITVGHVDLRTHIPQFLPVVKFESGKDSKGVPHDYWVIEDTFYFELSKRNDRLSHGFLYSFDRAWATFFLSAIVCLGIHLAISYFVDFTLDTQITLASPDMCDTIDSSYQCFRAGDLFPVDCMGYNGTVHCFKFYRFGVDVDLISAVSQSFAFYLVAAAVFARIFSALKIILHIKPSKWWGLGFVAFGVLATIGGIILGVLWVYGYADPKIEEILHFNVINLAQYFMVCTYVLMVGLLLLVAKWWERIDTGEHSRHIKKQLIHYEDANRGDIEKLAHARQDKGAGPATASLDAKP